MFANKFANKNGDNLRGNDLEDITKIQKAAERMQVLIRDILAMAKVDIDPSELVNTDINLLIREVILELDDEIATKGAKVTVEEIPHLVIHPRLIKLLFHNLITNALKYCKPGVNPEVRIFTQPIGQPKASGGKLCNIQVQDNGVGFDQRYAKKIFDMFTRLQTGTDNQGTGLGLALCKKIAEHHMGTIVAQGEPNVGAVFTIALPINGSGRHRSDNARSSRGKVF
jgi:signal transduction histidine kinase